MLLEHLQTLLLETKFAEWVDLEEYKSGMKLHNKKAFHLWFSIVLGSQMHRLDNYTIPEVNRRVREWAKTKEGAKAIRNRSKYINEMTSSCNVVGGNQSLGLLRRPGAKTAVETTPEGVNNKLNKKASKKTKKKIRKS